jgi:hypothetical protein
MSQNAYIQALQNQQDYAQRLQQQQAQEQEQRKKKSSGGSILISALAADSIYNDGEIRKAISNSLFGDSSSPTTIGGLSPTTPVASSVNGGTVLANQSVAPMTPTGVVEPVTSFNYGQGILGGVQAIQGLSQLRQGNMLGGGINTVAGGANIAASLGSQTGASIAGVATPIAGLYGAYQTAKLTGAMPTGSKRNTSAAVSGAASGAAIGSVIPGIGTAIGAVIGGLAGFLGSDVFGSSKDKDQMKRDAVRKQLQKVNFLDKDFNLKLADGSIFSGIKIDGKAKEGYGVLPDGRKMHAFDLNHEDPLVQKLIPRVNPLVAVLTGGDQKLTSDFTGYLVRAAMSNSGGDYNKALANVQSFYRQLDANPKLLHEQIDAMLSSNKIDATTAKIWKDDITRTTAGMKWGDTPAPVPTGGRRAPAQPKIPPPPPPSGNQNFAAEFNQRNQQNNAASQQQDVGAMYSSFARNFVPQQQRSIG